MSLFSFSQARFNLHLRNEGVSATQHARRTAKPRSFHRRKIIKNRGHFPSDEAAAKLIYLALRNITARWKMPPVIWKAAMNQFAIRYADRFAVLSV